MARLSLALLSLFLAIPAQAQVKRAIMEGTAATSDTIYVDTINVRVGIGDASPSYRLDVAGDVRSTGSITAVSFVGSGVGLTGLPGGGDAVKAATQTWTGENTFKRPLVVNGSSITAYGAISGSSFAINGEQVLFSDSGNNRLHFGIGAGAVDAGSGSTFLGYTSGYNNSSGTENTFVGSAAGLSNTTGSKNTFVGLNAGYKSTTGTGNTMIGNRTSGLVTAISGSSNTVLGASAGATITSGQGNILIGHGVNVPAGSTSNYLKIGDLITGVIGGSSVTVHGGLYASSITVSGNISANGRLMVPMGELAYFSTTGTLITVPGTSDGSTNMALVNPASTFTATSEQFTISSNGRLLYTGATTRMFHIAITVSGTPAVANDIFVFGAAKNGTVLTPSKVLGSSAGTQFSSLHVYSEMATNEYIELYIGNITATRNFTVKSLNIFAMGM